jgi:hypothetical protein
MANIFSHPAYLPSGNYQLVGYNLVKSAAVSGAPSYFGPWTAVSGYTGYTSNLDIYDPSGDTWDLYRVQPIVALPSGPNVSLEFSRPFTKDTKLYDGQISSVIDHFRRSYLNDYPIPGTDATNVFESTGLGAAPFLTNGATSRFYLSFIPNTEPVKFRPETTLVYAGSPVSPLVPYSDFYPNGNRGFIDFKNVPSTDSYLKVEYEAVTYSDDEVRAMLVNAVSSLQKYGISDYQVGTSWNLSYLINPLPNRDLADIICEIAQHTLLSGQIFSSFQNAEAWKDGSIQYTADPSRSIQAGTVWHTDQEDKIKRHCNTWIQENRTYFARGEWDSFFDNSGIFYFPFGPWDNYGRLWL